MNIDKKSHISNNDLRKDWFLRNIYPGTFILFAFFRLLGDTLLYIFGNVNSDSTLLWKIFSSLFVLSPLFVYHYKHLKDILKQNDYSGDDFLKDLAKILSYLILTATLLIILPDAASYGNEPYSIFGLIYIDMFIFISLWFVFLVMSFLLKWLMIRRHRRTKGYLKFLLILYIYFFITDAFKLEKSGDILVALSSILFLLSFIVMILTTKKTSWIALQTKENKIKLIFFSFLFLTFSIILFSIGIQTNSDLNKAMLFLIPGGSTILNYTLLLGIAYFTRIFISTILSLPTSSIVEKHTHEISSLTYLNNLINQNIDFNKLIEVVTKLASNSTSAYAAWTEIYSYNFTKVPYSINVDRNLVLEAHNSNKNKGFSKSDSSHYVESLGESDDYKYIRNVVPGANSLIATPLFEGKNRVGTLVVLHLEEYGFERDDVKIMAAFSDNISIALENARLLEASIQNERYKKELMLAKEMQERLLPTELPKFDELSIAAFCIPAEEVGGDYYDVVYLKNNNPCILIGDVSGKGMLAAFTMAQVKGIVLAHAKTSESPAELMCKVNDTLLKIMDRHTYITMSAIEFVCGQQKIRITRAGHMPIFISRKSEIETHQPDGLGLGLVSSEIFDEVIEEIEIDFKSDDTCLLITDGVNELRNKGNEDFGFDPLIDILKEHGTNATDINYKILEALRDYAGEELQHDDITVFTIKKN